MMASLECRAAVDGLAKAVEHAAEQFIAYGNGEYLTRRNDFRGGGNALAAPKGRKQGYVLHKADDFRLERDSCILESELGVVDASLSTQLRALENAFKSKIQQ